MSFAFISYKREDETRVGRIARALEKAGIEVWWDRGLPGGESWQANIEAQLNAASCVIVVWSTGAVAPEGHYVRDEARRGLARGILVPVLIDPIKDIPLGFGEIQAIDLCRWKGDPRDPFFLDLVAAVRAKIAGLPAPKPGGPAARVARRLTYGGVSTAAAAVIAAVAFNTFGATAKVCSLPGPQPELSDSCGAMGLGSLPTKAERLAWAKLPAGSCAALKAHIRRFPDGAYSSRAAKLLQAREVSYEDAWTPVTRRLAIFNPSSGPAAADETAAKAGALGRAQTEAERMCKGFEISGLYRFVSATLRAESWSCSAAGGVICGFDGHADCALEQHHQIELESCGPKA